MTNTLARIKKLGKNFEIIVNLEDALKFKKGEISNIEAEGDRIFSDSKKGFVASNSDLKEAFGSENIEEIIPRIIKEGEVLLTQEHRDEEKERKIKQIVDFLSTNAVDPQSGTPHSVERIKNSLEQININLKNKPLESQIGEIVDELSKIIPIKISIKKVRIIIPASYVGKAYGIVNTYKEKEDWKNDGSLEIIVNVPAGLIMDFYDKLNAITHGSAITEDIKDE